MHGISHVAGGPDPIPGLLPRIGSTYRDTIKATPALWAYWPLSDTAGPTLLEEIAGRDMTAVDYLGPGTPRLLSYGLEGPIVDDPGTSVGFTGHDSSSSLVQGTRAYYELTTPDAANLVLGGVETCTLELWFYPDVPSVPNSVAVTNFAGYLLSVGDAGFVGAAHNLSLDADGNLIYTRGADAVTSIVAPTVAGWNHVAVTYDGTTATLYLNGVVTATLVSGSVAVAGGNLIQVGRNTWDDGAANWFEGRIAHVAVYTEALDPATIAAHATGETVGGGPGSVLGVDENGDIGWVEPTVEVEHGDVALDETPVAGDASVYAGFPTSSSGWHLAAHTETIVLYDTNPARFVVPTRTWTRVPFDTIGIWRQWEATVGAAQTTSKWLPDDRGLTDQAKRGILHITADMLFDDPQSVGAWFSIEWPVIDADRLPNEPATGLDAYVRAGRIMDVSHGVVLRASPGDTLRRFFEWQMPDAHDEIPVWVDYPSDNPYPIYPVWAARPLTLPDPYPHLDELGSGFIYAPRKSFGMDANLTAGDNLCLQVWQDSPWTLRFSTDTFEAGYNTVPAYQHRPYLSVQFSYDPETIDHTTGKLL